MTAIVDTSVWVNYLRGCPTAATDLLDEWLGNRYVAITDMVMFEILQGLRSDNKVSTERMIASLPVFRLEGLEDFERGASIFRAARERGLTPRRGADCLIASVCIRENVPLLHEDADFDRIASCSDLQVIPIRE